MKLSIRQHQRTGLLTTWRLAAEALADSGPYQAAHFDAELDAVSHSGELRALAFAVHALCLIHRWRRVRETPAQFRDRMRAAGPYGPLPGTGCGLADKEEPW